MTEHTSQGKSTCLPWPWELSEGWAGGRPVPAAYTARSAGEHPAGLCRPHSLPLTYIEGHPMGSPTAGLHTRDGGPEERGCVSRDTSPSVLFGAVVRTTCVLAAQSCLTLRDPTNCSPPGSSVHGILQAGRLEWAAISFSRGLPDPGIEPRPAALQGGSSPSEPPGKLRSLCHSCVDSAFSPCQDSVKLSGGDPQIALSARLI